MTAAKRRPKRKRFDVKNYAWNRVDREWFTQDSEGGQYDWLARSAVIAAYRLGRRHGREEAKGKR